MKSIWTGAPGSRWYFTARGFTSAAKRNRCTVRRGGATGRALIATRGGRKVGFFFDGEGWLG